MSFSWANVVSVWHHFTLQHMQITICKMKGIFFVIFKFLLCICRGQVQRSIPGGLSRLWNWRSPARQCEWQFGRASGKQDWESGILYRLYKRLPSSGECQKFLVSQPAFKLRLEMAVSRACLFLKFGLNDFVNGATTHDFSTSYRKKVLDQSYPGILRLFLGVICHVQAKFLECSHLL